MEAAGEARLDQGTAAQGATGVAAAAAAAAVPMVSKHLTPAIFPCVTQIGTALPASVWRVC